MGCCCSCRSCCRVPFDIAFATVDSSRSNRSKIFFSASSVLLPSPPPSGQLHEPERETVCLANRTDIQCSLRPLLPRWIGAFRAKGLAFITSRSYTVATNLDVGITQLAVSRGLPMAVVAQSKRIKETWQITFRSLQELHWIRQKRQEVSTGGAPTDISARSSFPCRGMFFGGRLRFFGFSLGGCSVKTNARALSFRADFRMFMSPVLCNRARVSRTLGRLNIRPRLTKRGKSNGTKTPATVARETQTRVSFGNAR